jgi:Double zinc ribbon
MSSLSCRFCGSPNPEGSKFCNQCGSPLNLVPCARCEAINNVADDRCSACGASLWEAVDEAPGRDAMMETAEAMHDAAMSGGAVPVALAHRLSDVSSDAHDDAHVSYERFEPRLAEVDGFARDLAHAPAEESASESRDTAAHASEWKPRRAPRAIAAVVFVALGAAVAWISLNGTNDAGRTIDSTQPLQPPAAPMPATQPATDTASTSAPATTPSSAQPATEPTTSQDRATEPAGSQLPATEPAASQLPATESTASQAPAAAQPPAATSTEPSNTTRDVDAAAPAASESDAPVAADASKPAPSSRARSTSEASRRAAAQARAREQAERDAIATQRIIARELGIAPPAPRGSQRPR